MTAPGDVHVPSAGGRPMDVAMTPADAGAPLTHGEGGFVPVAHRGLQWVAQQLAPSVEDGELARLQAEYRWKWFAGGDSESREDFVTDVNAELRRHLAGNMPGWCAAMTSSAKVVGLHEQVARALYGNRGDLSELKARAAFHRTQTKEQCVDWCATRATPATPSHDLPPHAQPPPSRPIATPRPSLFVRQRIPPGDVHDGLDARLH